MQQVFNFPAETSILEKIGNIAADLGSKIGFSEIEIGDLQLALDEVCSNTIIHGLKQNPALNFKMVINLQADEIEILIHESGATFNLEDIKQPDINAPLEERPIGGLGIFMAHKVMDLVELHTNADGLKTLRLLKKK